MSCAWATPSGSPTPRECVMASSSGSRWTFNLREDATRPWLRRTRCLPVRSAASYRRPARAPERPSGGPRPCGRFATQRSARRPAVAPRSTSPRSIKSPVQRRPPVAQLLTQQRAPDFVRPRGERALQLLGQLEETRTRDGGARHRVRCASQASRARTPEKIPRADNGAGTPRNPFLPATFRLTTRHVTSMSSSGITSSSQTAVALASAQPPAKTERRSNIRCSRAESNS